MSKCLGENANHFNTVSNETKNKHNLDIVIVIVKQNHPLQTTTYLLVTCLHFHVFSYALCCDCTEPSVFAGTCHVT